MILLDKLSYRILKFISQHEKSRLADLIDQFGINAEKSISYLESNGFISSAKIGSGYLGKDAHFTSIGIYSVTSYGLSFLQAHPGQTFDRWLTRILAIWGAITGTAALLLELMQ